MQQNSLKGATISQRAFIREEMSQAFDYNKFNIGVHGVEAPSILNNSYYESGNRLDDGHERFG